MLDEESKEALAFHNISESQRQCLSHILRNCEQALEGILAVVENRNINLTPSDLAVGLVNINKKISQVFEAANSGVFCALCPEECKFVAPYVKCEGRPELPIKTSSV